MWLLLNSLDLLIIHIIICYNIHNIHSFEILTSAVSDSIFV